MEKSIILPLFSLFLISLTSISCQNDKKTQSEKLDNQTTQKGLVYGVDTVNSKIEWKGYKILKSDQTSHFGTIRFESGEVTVHDGKLESGKFVANTKTLENVDLNDDPEQKAKLEGHLKSADFLDVQKFPTATFEITKVTDSPNGSDYNTVLDGNLTIKGITKPIQFKANVSIKDGMASIATEPQDINREDFGVVFQIPAANGLLQDEVNLQILVKAIENK